ncbi:MAG: imidazolonepropionase-like domain-containing protein, partial [Candidatus Wenzhouxiangella sp. M2_3B_020]
MRSLFTLLLLACAAVQAAAAEPAGMLVNAQIRTMDPDRPNAEALAWGADGRILAVGDADELAANWPDIDAIDAGGRFVIPGLVDAHG